MPQNIRPVSQSHMQYPRSQLNTTNDFHPLDNNLDRPTTSESSTASGNNEGVPSFRPSNLIGKKVTINPNAATVYQDTDTRSTHSANDVPPSYSEAIFNMPLSKTNEEVIKPNLMKSRSMSTNFLINGSSTSTNSDSPIPPPPPPPNTNGLFTTRKVPALKISSVHYRPRDQRIQINPNGPEINRPESIRLIKFD